MLGTELLSLALLPQSLYYFELVFHNELTAPCLVGKLSWTVSFRGLPLCTQYWECICTSTLTLMLLLPRLDLVILLFVYECVPACVWVYLVCACCLPWNLGCGCELVFVCWELSLGYLQTQHVFSIADPPLPPPPSFLSKYWDLNFGGHCSSFRKVPFILTSGFQFEKLKFGALSYYCRWPGFRSQ